MNRTTYATTLDTRLMQPVLDIATQYQLVQRPVQASQLVMASVGAAP
jgi:hypothetical protein